MGTIRTTWGPIALIVLMIGLASGCGTSAPMAPSRSMQYEKHQVTAPPRGQALVCIHRPRDKRGRTVFTRVWRGTNLIADLGNGQSLACISPPGQQYFVNHGPKAVSVVEAELLADQTYDLWIDTSEATDPSFQLKPVRSGAAERDRVMAWSEENIWIAPRTGLQAEPESVALTKEILEGPAEGSTEERRRRLGPQDHR